MKSLKQLYTMAMDAHSRFRTESHQEVTARFNERFLLSLTQCNSCLVLDDELNLLPLSARLAELEPVSKAAVENSELANLKTSLASTEFIGALLKQAKTLDQAKAVLTCLECVSEKSLRYTISVTASRGRGKSAALGIAIAGAIAYGYSNILVTAPSPENLGTLFEFVKVGFTALDLKEHLHYEFIESTNPAFNKAIVRVNVFKSHRQTVQYFQPQDTGMLGQCELMVVDEAAAIPLPLVKKLLGPYLTFLSSTINGYEGTGRSLSLKLFKQLREQSETAAASRSYKEVNLSEPIRYSKGDQVEAWLNRLLCLDATLAPRIASGCPVPADCELYYVSRDTLFSFNKKSEEFLQRLVALFVSSHYKNTPDDLLLMSDAPAHHLYVLLGPVDPKSKELPEILCAVQIGLEGEISKGAAAAALRQGQRATGDLIPWTVSQQFQDPEFASLSGGRIVRIATHPDYQRMGYGRRALDLLQQYFEGRIASTEEAMPEPTVARSDPADLDTDGTLQSEKLAPRANLPPLLTPLQFRPAEPLHYLGTSFGVTAELFKFWRSANYRPLYLRQTANAVTGEHSCIMVQPLESLNPEVTCRPDWAEAYSYDFVRRFAHLSAYDFSSFPCALGLSLLAVTPATQALMPPLDAPALSHFFLPHDIGRLDSYTRNMLDFHVIMDLLPGCAQVFFLFNSGIEISPAQRVILVGLGLQHRSVESVGEDLRLPPTQVLALFMKCMKKFANRFNTVRIAAAEVTADLNNAEQRAKRIRVERAQDDSKQVEASGREVLEKKQAELLASLPMEQFALGEDLSSRPPPTTILNKKNKNKKQHSNKPNKPNKSNKDKKRKHH